MYLDFFALMREIPHDELEEARNLADIVQNLLNYRARFNASLKLFDTALDLGRQIDAQVKQFEATNGIEQSHAYRQQVHPQERVFREWLHISGRDGAVTIYHFGVVLKAFNQNLTKCPTIFQKINRQEIKTANQDFKKNFPQFERMRHAVAHEAELFLTENQKSENQMDGVDAFGISVSKGTKVLAANCLNGRTYYAGFSGKIVSYDITDETDDCLLQIATRVAKALALGTSFIRDHTALV